ncbi:MAG: DUF2147 domain-containing protein [Alphaproteobacteria bacterium]|jgi:uncharacterized protein (DUF2147 family)|nr:DUF2147 domain-containing protein [Alphaproteobacteria bacterium]
MKYKSFIRGLVAGALFCGVTFSHASLEGVWRTLKPEKNADIEIEKCQDDPSTFCGKIVALQEPTYPDGSPKVDKHNKDASKQTRPLLGLELISGFKKSGDNEWDSGKIYNPEDGDVYDCTIRMYNEGGEDKLEVRGYVGVPLFGKSQTWVRKKSEN